MSMFGKPEDFAIEAMVESELTSPSALWGRLRVWVEGNSFGDFDDPYCGLYPAYCGFRDMLDKIEELYDPELMDLSIDKLYAKVDKALYGVWVDGEFLDEDSEEGDEVYWRHNFLANWGEMFDQAEKSYIFKLSDNRLMVIQPKKNGSSIIKHNCSVIEFKNVIDQFLVWYDREEYRLSGKDV
jgi:hypothetical protein